ncbi:segregation/condensation protein A [Treponema denticola]|uniref:segregation and condensation protein A n=1 Tax=Treponema denticola TaxID=158 RepID=UPI0020A4A9B6|nr:segregation/condensation protein A [Treponema denticola]UTC95813.1 segregation/condensation protein A [Treponema denticola]
MSTQALSHIDKQEVGYSNTEFKVHNFEGPLDLLLFLINKNEVNIYDIPIAEITEQYLEYLDYAIEPDLDNLVDFYSMAANLIYIKSRMLLPVEVSVDDEDIEDPRSELVDKLIEYQKYKKLSELMEEKESEAEWFFERKKIQHALPFGEEELWERVDTWDLLKTFSQLMSNYKAEHILDLYEEVSVNEKITLMNEFLEKKGECMFTDLIVRKGNLMDVVCAFMAILEAVKFKMASIWQNRMFGDIKIRPWEQDNGSEL